MFASSCLERSCQVLIINQLIILDLAQLSVDSIYSQELLASVESDKHLRSRGMFNPENQGNEVEIESDDEQPIMRHVAAIASRARNLTRRRREMTFFNTSSLEHQNIDLYSSDADSR